jgi:hypothetical protein
MSKKSPEQAIEDKIEAFRKNITKKYQKAVDIYQYEVKDIIKVFYENPANKDKEFVEPPEVDIETSDQTKNLYKKWEPLLAEYKKITGKSYKKPILFNPNKESSKKSGQKEKDTARKARDALIAAKEKAKPVAKPVKAKPPKNTGYAEAKKLYDKPAPKLEEIVIQTTSTVPAKVTKGLFSDMKDIVNTIIENERKIPGMQPNYGDRDRTGKLLTADEIAQLKRIRATINKIPENVIIAPVEVKQEVKRKRGRPVVEGSLRQAKLAAPKPEAKRRGRPKKITVEETKEETKQEETKDEPKKRRGRPVVEGSKRQQKLAVEKKPRGRPKKEAAPKAKVGRPSKCDTIPPKTNEKRPMTQLAPVISRFEIEDNKIKLKSNEMVNPELLKYSKLTPQIFFTVMEGLPVKLSDEITKFYDKKTTRTRFAYVYKLVCSYIVAKGLTTAHDIEVALVTRIIGDLADEPKKLKAFMNFVRKNCIAKAPTQEIKKAVPRAKASKEYPLDKLTAFNDTKYDFTKESFMDIIKNTFIGKQANIRKTGANYERVARELLDTDADEPTGPKEYEEISQTLLAKSIINNLLESADDLKPALFEKLDAEYKADKAGILRQIKEYLDKL